MKLIIADDSAVIRAILEQNLGKMEGVEIIASVSNGRRAVDSARAHRPDAVISDIDMPEMDGIEAARTLCGELRVPVLILSEDDGERIRARQAGAFAFVKKPALDSYTPEFFDSLVASLSAEAMKKAERQPASRKASLSAHKAAPPVRQAFKVVCLGASTGGPSAVAQVLQGLGGGFPLPILYVQHIDVGADQSMVDWFNTVCPDTPVHLAEDGTEALAGNVYMAPADAHLVVDYVAPSGRPVLGISHEEPERFLRPAVNKLFRSAAQHYRRSCLAVLLTGMGRDGADGCRKITGAGGWTIAEDKSTCAVFGMPAAAIELGAASEVLARGDIAPRLRELSAQ